jgi:hypothetical protein
MKPRDLLALAIAACIPTTGSYRFDTPMYITIEDILEVPYDPPPPLPLPESWCATPRPEELLLLDEARRFIVDGLPMGPELRPHSAIEIVTDEATCQRAAQAFSDNTPSDIHAYDTRSVFVVRVGNVYLVENLKPRHGYRRGFWEVLIFDDDWKHHGGYGDGA